MATPPARRNTGAAQFFFVLGATIAVISMGIIVLVVSLPNGLKFALVAIAATLALICAGLYALAQSLS